MADRGRKNQLVCSPILDERWKKHDRELHRQRLKGIKPMIDTSEPASTQHKPSAAKKEEMKRTRQEQIDYENHVLLQKLVNIKNFDSWSAFKPWLARSTFQYEPGKFYDPTTGAKCVDHLNPTAYLSPRSSHAPGRPATAPTSYSNTQRYLQTLEENSKLLHAIDGTRSAYQIGDLARSAAENALHSRRLSNYRGPEHARYVPSPLHVSPNQKMGRFYAYDPQRPHTAMASTGLHPLGGSLGSPSYGQARPSERQGRKSSTAPHPALQSPLTGTSPTQSPESSAKTAAIESDGTGMGTMPPTRPSSQQPATKGDGWMRHQAELAELGVVNEEPDDASEFEREIAASRMANGSHAVPDLEGASSVSSSSFAQNNNMHSNGRASSAGSQHRPGSARPQSQGSFKGSNQAAPTITPLHTQSIEGSFVQTASGQLLSPIGSASSRTLSTQAAPASIGLNPGSRPSSSHSQHQHTSPYLQPVSPHQQARTLQPGLASSMNGGLRTSTSLGRHASAASMSTQPSATMQQVAQEQPGLWNSASRQGSIPSVGPPRSGASSAHSSRPSSARFVSVPALASKTSGAAGAHGAGGVNGSGATTPHLAVHPVTAALTPQQHEHSSASMADQELALADAMTKSASYGGSDGGEGEVAKSASYQGSAGEEGQGREQGGAMARSSSHGGSDGVEEKGQEQGSEVTKSMSYGESAIEEEQLEEAGEAAGAKKAGANVQEGREQHEEGIKEEGSNGAAQEAEEHEEGTKDEGSDVKLEGAEAKQTGEFGNASGTDDDDDDDDELEGIGAGFGQQYELGESGGMYQSTDLNATAASKDLSKSLDLNATAGSKDEGQVGEPLTLGSNELGQLMVPGEGSNMGQRGEASGNGQEEGRSGTAEEGQSRQTEEVQLGTAEEDEQDHDGKGQSDTAEEGQQDQQQEG